MTDDAQAHECDICDKRFDTERALRRHVREQGIIG